MKKKIKKYGTSHVITIDPEELEWFNLKAGDWIRIHGITKLKKREVEEDDN